MMRRAIAYHTKEWLKLAVMAVFALITMGSCSDDDSDVTPAGQWLQQIVTYDGNEGGNVVFRYQAVDDSPVITLTTPGRINENQARKGDRLLLTYRLASDRNPMEGGKISVSGLYKILTDTVDVVATPLPEPSPLYLLTIQRSGQYIDITAQMYKTDKRKITVSTDGVADADGFVTLIVDATSGPDTDKAYMAPAWASLWIGPQWNRSDITGVRVVLNNSNNPYRNEFTFRKQH